MFEEEKPHLQPLPLVGMRYFTEAQRTVCDDTCVRVDHSSYAARPAPIGSRVLVRVFEHRIEIRDLQDPGAAAHPPPRRAPRHAWCCPTTSACSTPRARRATSWPRPRPSAPTRQRLCELLFAIEGRVGQRKLWGIVGLAERYPRRLVDSACARALRRRRLQLPARQGRSPSGWSPRRWRPSTRRCRPDAGRARADPGAPADPQRPTTTPSCSPAAPAPAPTPAPPSTTITEINA